MLPDWRAGRAKRRKTRRRIERRGRIGPERLCPRHVKDGEGERRGEGLRSGAKGAGREEARA